MHFTLVVDFYVKLVTNLSMGRPNCADRDVLFANRRPHSRGDETDFLATTFLRVDVRIVGFLVAFDVQFHQAPVRAFALFFSERTTPIEIRLLEVNEPVETQLKR